MTVSSCPMSPCHLQGRCLGRRAVGALPPMPGAGLELGTTSTYHAFEVQPSTGRLFHSKEMPRGSADHNKHHIVVLVCVCVWGGDSHLFSEPPRPGLMHCSAPDLQWPGLSSLPPVPALTDPGPTSVKSRQSQLQPPVLLLCPHWATSPKAGLACAQEGSLQGSLVLMGSKQSPSAEQARRPL